MRWAVYDLRSHPPSFDFLTFLVLAKYHGAHGVWFIPGVCDRKLGQYDAVAQAERMRTIVFPACELYGMQYQSGQPKGLDVAWPPYFGTPFKVPHGYLMGWLRGIRPEPIMPTPEARAWADSLAGGQIVVHLRRTPYQTARNSGPDWERWAKAHDAYVLSDEPISLDRRIALHEVARLNIGVNGGTMAISEYSTHRPYVVLKRLVKDCPATTAEWFRNHGYQVGEKWHWAGKHQQVVWDDRDDCEAIETAYQGWLKEAEKPPQSKGEQSSKGTRVVSKSQQVAA